MTEFWELLSYPFVTRALIVGTLVSLCASTLGVVLTLKRYALIGHGLSEVAFASFSLSVALGLPPLLFSAPLVILASFAILYVSQRRRVGGDIAIAVAGSAALSVGALATALSGGPGADAYGYLFGSILAMTESDVLLSAALALVVLSLFLLFYNRLFLIAESEDYARSLGLNVPFYQALISILTALTVVLGMRMMGTLLISSLIILPSVTARRLLASSGFRALVVASAVLSLLCFFGGFFLSFLWDLPTGASIVGVNLVLLLLAGVARR
ncbi:MAG: metal ABC transporter permease [Synergistaceae bacterium]|nr:metal ABC transporter permease [Synergistaceae bacterium]